MNPEELFEDRIQQIRHAQLPVTGPFFWVPKPHGKNGKWKFQIVPFFQPDEKHQIGHTRAWPEVLRLLAHWWGRSADVVVKQLQDHYTGLPRGRVVKMTGGYGIAHGNDHSDPNFAATVRSLYCLPDETQPFFDEHERMIPGDPERFQRVMKIQTGLKGVEPDFDESDSEEIEMTPLPSSSRKPPAKKASPIKKTAKSISASVKSKKPDADRRINQADRLARTIKILQLIMGRGRWNNEELAKEFQCSERTIYRHLTVLRLAAVPWYYDKTQKCYRVEEYFKFPILNLDQDEILGLGVSAAISSATGLDIAIGKGTLSEKWATRTSAEKAQLLTEAQQLVSVLGLNLANHSGHEETIRTVQRALIHRKKLSGLYRTPYAADPIRLTLEPIRLCLIKQAWYLIARKEGESAPKAFRIMRFQSLKMLEKPAHVPEDFDLAAFFGNAWGVYRGEKTYDIQIRFTPDAAPLVTETIWHRTQQAQPQPDGSVILSFQVDGLEEIVHWLLSWTGRAEVLTPPELRELLVGYLKKGLELNQG